MIRIAIALALLAAPSYALTFPKDCNAAKLRREASKGGCSVENGAKHHKVMKNGQQVTLIPNTVKPTKACRNIINAINNSCR